MAKLFPHARRVRVRALQTSALVLALVQGSGAFAQCAPEPTQTNGTTTCAGTDSDGLSVTTYGTTVSVPVGATVLTGGGPAIDIRLPSNVSGSRVGLSVAGRVDGGSQAGVSLLTQAPATGFGFGSADLSMTVAQGGTVGGVNAIVVGQAGGGQSQARVTLDNAGTLTGTGGIALLSSIPHYGGFSSITNRETGLIGAISASVGTLTNAGTIDGGALSAVSFLDPRGLVSGDVGNTGSILSNSTTATLANLAGFRRLSNSGTISNRGTGFAVAGTTLSIINESGGRISSAGGIAIRAETSLGLTNAGVIDGDILINGYSSSSIDSTAGTINGNLSLGSGNNSLTAIYDRSGLRTGITGTINGGFGTDTLTVRFTGDATLDRGVILPNRFEQLVLMPEADVTTTLSDGFVSPERLIIGGDGTIINLTTLSARTQALVAGTFETTGYTTIINAGTISTAIASSDTFALNMSSTRRFENTGTINAAGNGVNFSSQGLFVNSGTIVAGLTGVDLFGESFDNSGTIRSTGGIGADLSGSYGSNWVNSGRIEGAVAGVRIGSTLVNSGTITSAVTGVLLDWHSMLDNRAGGVVTGGTLAIGPEPRNFGLVRARIANAGTINGDVVLASDREDSYNANTFYALPGGVLNGNLRLGRSDTLITELANSGPGAFAGITGTVTATGSLLRYRVREDASARLDAPAGFAKVGFDLYDDATLTLTGSTARTLDLAGDGSVDLNGDLTSDGSGSLISVGTILAPLDSTEFTPSSLSITNRGALTFEHVDPSTYMFSVVGLNAESDFTNLGTLTVLERVIQPFGETNGIVGGKDITNVGTIALAGAIGVADAASLTNSGSITQVAGGHAANGVRNVRALTNSGTIDVAGNAVQVGFDSRTIVNSGLIASSNGVAIASAPSTTSPDLTITNLAGATIRGGTGQPAIRLLGARLDNAGTITGSVDLGSRSFRDATYIANGGTIDGNLLFGSGDDLLVVMNGVVGVSGTIDGGEGDDLLMHGRDTSGVVTLGEALYLNFEQEGVRALGADTVVTIAAANPLDADVQVSGDGNIVNTATINGAVRTYFPRNWTGSDQQEPGLASFTNDATILGRFDGITDRFVNNGTIGSTDVSTAVRVRSTGDLSFENSGQVIGSDGIDLTIQGGSITARNSGSITGALFAEAGASWSGQMIEPVAASISFENSGTILGVDDAVGLSISRSGDSAIAFTNTGTLEMSGVGAEGVGLSIYRTFGAEDMVSTAAITAVNAGTIRANGGGEEVFVSSPWFGSYRYTSVATAMQVSGDSDIVATVTNQAGGLIEATGALSVAVMSSGVALDLTNAGTIRGTDGSTLAEDDLLVGELGSTYLAGAIHAVGDANDRIVNTGTIVGSIDLGAGNDYVENRGRIEGDVFLGSGDDTFLHLASAVLVGTVDAGEGDDSLIIDATGGGAVNGDQFVNFNRFSQIGEGSVAYSGNFRFDTIDLSGGTVRVGAGETLSSASAVAVTGGNGSETVLNDGTIAGSLDLAGGSDRVVNRGTILGSVLLGSGNDQFVDHAGSRVDGAVDGGAGNDLYTVMLTGDRSGIGQRTSFERLSVEGNGSLTLTLDQDFEAVSLAGTGLNLTLAEYGIGSVTGTGAAETLTVDGDLASVALGAGDDALSIGTTTAAGRYDGGAGNDLLRFTATGPVVLSGNATGFEQLSLAGSALTVTGTLGTAGAPLSFGSGDQQLTVGNGGTLAGVIDLGAGNDVFRLATGGTLTGTVAGGVGNNLAIVELAGNRTLANILTGFEALTTEGSGELSLTGAHAYDRVTSSADLSVAIGGSLTAGQVQFGTGNNRFTIAGGFAGSVDGGAGNDAVMVSGGTSAAPVAFVGITNIEQFGMSGGYATIAGSAALGSIDLSGGRLVGLAGSTINASQILVRQGATFGSAGTVNGNLTVSGILSPGASPGTMTVNGNVALQAGSLSMFELTPSVSDQLIVNGTVSIAQGSTLQVVSVGTLRPGTSYDLIIASGGITGSYSTILKSDDLFGFIVQRADRIQLLGQFLDNAAFTPQVSASIAYANTALAAQPATSRLFDALPALLDASGNSNPAAFARLTPEPYASASQVGVDNALMLAGTARGSAFATTGNDVHAYTFAQGVGGWRRLGNDADAGVPATRSQSYGFLGGLGVGNAAWSVGAFAGYLNDHQRIDTLDARTRTDGFVAGVHGRYMADNGFGFTASVLYNGGNVRTERALPGATSAIGRYDLNSWVSDLSVNYGLDVDDDWMVRPRAGITYIRTTREGLTETGGSPFALTVARDRHVAGFADTGLFIGRSETSEVAFRPFVSLGARYQIEGQRTDAVAGYADAGLGLVALGAQRAPLVGTVAAGVGYRLSGGLELFSTAAAQTGRDDHQETITTGVRLRF